MFTTGDMKGHAKRFDLDFQGHAIKIEFFHYHRWIPWPRKHTHEKYFWKIRTGRPKSRGVVPTPPLGVRRWIFTLGICGLISRLRTPVIILSNRPLWYSAICLLYLDTSSYLKCIALIGENTTHLQWRSSLQISYIKIIISIKFKIAKALVRNIIMLSIYGI